MLHKEIEYKCKINESDYLKLINIFDSEPIKHINYYFDTINHFFYDNKIVIRIRHIEDSEYAELTIKSFIKDSISLEDNLIIDLDTMNSLINNGFNLNTYFKDYNENVLYITNLVDTRLEIKYDNGLLVFDKSNYNNITDYEIEYESKSVKNGFQRLLTFLNENNIPYEKSNHKITRVFETIVKK
jgi:uncharacterized protein YjbK